MRRLEETCIDKAELIYPDDVELEGKYRITLQLTARDHELTNEETNMHSRNLMIFLVLMPFLCFVPSLQAESDPFLAENETWEVQLDGYDITDQRYIRLGIRHKATGRQFIGKASALRLLKQQSEEVTTVLAGNWGLLLVDRHQYGPKIITFHLDPEDGFSVERKVSCYYPRFSSDKNMLVYTHYFPRMAHPANSDLAVHRMRITTKGIQDDVLYPEQFQFKTDITPYERDPDKLRSLHSDYHWTDDDRWVFFLEEEGYPSTKVTKPIQDYLVGLRVQPDVPKEEKIIYRTRIDKQQLFESEIEEPGKGRLIIESFHLKEVNGVYHVDLEFSGRDKKLTRATVQFKVDSQNGIRVRDE